MSLGICKPEYYKLRILTSDEIKGGIQTHEPQVSISTDILDPNRFGATSKKCLQCGLTEECPGHHGSIKLPFTIIYPLLYNKIITVISCVCGRCCKIPLTKDEKAKLARGTNKVYKDIKNEIKKKTTKKINCPYCENKEILQLYPVPVIIAAKYVKAFNILYSSTKIDPKNVIKGFENALRNIDLYDNHDIYNILYNLSKEDAFTLGFVSEEAPPHYFMFDYIAIAPPHAKKDNTQKFNMTNTSKSLYEAIMLNSSIVSTKIMNSKFTTLDTNTIIGILPHMYKIVIAINFLLTTISDRDKSVLEKEILGKVKSQSNPSFIGMLSHKDGVLRKNVGGTKHDVSARGILTGEPFAHLGIINFPKNYAISMDTEMRVKELNIMISRLFVLNGPNKYPGARVIYRGNRRIDITDKNKEQLAKSLIPGDVIGRHLINGDPSLHNRYPSIREESMHAVLLEIFNKNTIAMALAECRKMMADFDGDETNVFILYSAGAKAEALYLMSLLTQFISPFDGNVSMSIEDSHDANIGAIILTNEERIHVKSLKHIFDIANIKYTLDLETNIKDSDIIVLDKEYYTPNEIYEFIFPKELYYKDDKLEISNGKIISGKITPKHITSNNIVKSIAVNISNYDAKKILEKFTYISYGTNDTIGQTLGYEYKLGKSAKEKINYYVDETLDYMHNYQKNLHNGLIIASVGQSIRDYAEAVQTSVNCNYKDAEISKVIRNELSGTSLDKGGFLDSRQKELKAAIANIGMITINGHMLEKQVSNHSRITPFYQPYDVRPEALGYVKGSYLKGISMVGHMYDAHNARKLVFSKGNVVGIQGYLEYKMASAFSHLFVGYFGEVRGNANKILNQSYGHISSDPRAAIVIKSDHLVCDDKSFNERYNSEIKDEMQELNNIRFIARESYKSYAYLTSDNKYSFEQLYFESPIDFNYYINYYKPKYDEPLKNGLTFKQRENIKTGYVKNNKYNINSKKSKMSKEHQENINKYQSKTLEEIYEVSKEFDKNLSNIIVSDACGQFIKNTVSDRLFLFKSLYKFILSSKQLYLLGYDAELAKLLFNKIIQKLVYSFAQAGEPCGLKSMHNTTWPQTQDVLHSIHKKSVSGEISNIMRVEGTNRYTELLEGINTSQKSNKKDKIPVVVLTLTLKGDAKFDYFKNIESAKKINTIRMINCFSKQPDVINYEGVIPNAKENPMLTGIVNSYLESLPKTVRSSITNTYVNSNKLWLYFDTIALLINRISLVELQKHILEQSNNMVEYIMIEVTNKAVTHFVVYFKTNLPQAQIYVLSKNIIDKVIANGDGSYINSSVIEYNGITEIDENNKLVNKKSYRIEVNSLIPNGLNNIFKNKEFDPQLCFSNNIQENIQTFGLFEGKARLYEELLIAKRSVKDMDKSLKKHSSIIADYITGRGDLSYISRYMLHHNRDVDDITKISFEQTKDFVIDAIINPTKYPIDSPYSSIMYAKPMRMGTGISDIYFDKSNLVIHNDKEVFSKLDDFLGSAPKANVKKKVYSSHDMEHVCRFLEE